MTSEHGRKRGDERLPETSRKETQTERGGTREEEREQPQPPLALSSPLASSEREGRTHGRLLRRIRRALIASPSHSPPST